MNSDRPQKLEMIICKDSLLKVVKRSKHSETVNHSIPRDINPQDNYSNRNDPIPIELWNGTLQQSISLISPAILKWALDIFRHFCLKQWRIKIRHGFVQWHSKMWSILFTGGRS